MNGNIRWPWRLAALTVLGLASTVAQAVPSFARQTGSECVACHIGGVGAQLTAYGIRFKLSGYTDSDGKDGKVPLSARFQINAYNPNAGDAITRLDQAAILLAGRLTQNVGAMASVERNLDNSTGAITTGLAKTDLKFATETKLGNRDAIIGASLNNGPGAQDPLGTLPASGYLVVSYESRAFGQQWAHSMLSGRLANRSVGLTTFAFLDNSWYGEIGHYGAMSAKTADKLLGQDPVNDPGRMHGFSPYARMFYMKDWKTQFVTAGLVGMQSRIDSAPGGPADRLRDVGVDLSYGFVGTREHIFKTRAVWLREKRAYGFAPPGALSDATLYETTFTANYLYRNLVGVMYARTSTRSDSDSPFYRFFPNGQPGARFNMIGLYATPFGKEDSWGAPWANLRVGIYRLNFKRFNGASADLFGNAYVPAIPNLSARDIGATWVTAEVSF
jgi:hypothetical protein